MCIRDSILSLLLPDPAYLQPVLTLANGVLKFRDGGTEDTQSGFKVSPGLTRSSRVQLLGQSGQFIQISGSPAMVVLERGDKMFMHPLKLTVVLLNYLGQNILICDVAGPRSQEMAQETALGVSGWYQTP